MTRSTNVDRRTFAAAAGAVLASGCVGGSVRADGPFGTETGHNVDEADVTVAMIPEPSFDPKSVTIKVGDTVVWRNESRQIQSITAYEDRIPDDAEYFSSSGSGREVLATVVYPFGGSIEPDGEYGHKFETPGRYEYYSIPTEHLGMVGEVVVR